MHPPKSHIIRGHHFWLTAERCMFWEERKMLILSDLHFGKTGHFRKSGIPVPANIYTEDLQRLLQQIQYFQPQEVIFVGDLFHSRSNLEHDWFIKWRKDIPGVRMHLVRGNHDILADEDYADCDLEVHEDVFLADPFCFVHDLDAAVIDSDYYPVAGHLHPGIRMSGPGKQSLRFPCFYFTPEYGVLPAFSRFTGMAIVEPKSNENVFAIVENSLILVNG